MSYVIYRASVLCNDPVLTAVSKEIEWLNNKAVRALLSHVSSPEMSLFEELGDAIQSMFEFWDVFPQCPRGVDHKCRAKVITDICDIYSKVFSKQMTFGDFNSFVEGMFGDGWWSQSQKNKEIFDFIKKYFQSIEFETPSFL